MNEMIVTGIVSPLKISMRYRRL